MRSCVLCVTLAFGLSNGLVQAGVVDFEAFPDLTPITNQIPGLQFTNATAINSFGSLDDAEFPPHSGISVVFDDGGPMSILFSQPVSTVSAFFTYGAQLTFTAFDSGNAQVGSVLSAFNNNEAISGDPGSSPNENLSLSDVLGISKILITGDPAGGSFVMDDLSFTPLPGNAIPEPAGYSILLTPCLAARLIAKRWLVKT